MCALLPQAGFAGLVAVMVVAAGVLGCGGDSGDAQETVLFADPTESEPTYGTTPFPGDPWLDADGHIGALPGLEAIMPRGAVTARPLLATLDGFSTRPAVEVFVSAPIDPASLPEATSSTDDALFVLDEEGAAHPFDWRWDEARMRVVGSPRPGHVLTPGGRYTLVVTRGLRAADGALAPDAGFTRLLTMSSRAVPERYQTTRAAADALIANGFARRDLLAVMAFRVAHHRDALLAARAQLEQRPAPTLRFDDPGVVFVGSAALDDVLGTPSLDAGGVDEAQGWDNPTGMAHASIAVLGSGTLTTTRFRRTDLAPPLANDPRSGTFALNESGEPIVQDGADVIRISVALPSAPAPTSGYPVLLYGHGLGASRTQMTMMMETAARAGYATIAIDASSHGSRYSDVDVERDLAQALSAFSGTATGPDGFGDVEGLQTTFRLFHEFSNILAMRDEIAQTVLDWGSVVRMIRDPSVDLTPLLGGGPGPAPTLDGSRIVYFGESFGGIIGGLLAGVEPHLRAIVLCGPGGGILDLSGAHGPTLSGFLAFALTTVYRASGVFDRFHPVVALGSAMLDGGDPINFAPLAFDRAGLGAIEGRARDVVILESVGDEVLANAGTEGLAVSFGLSQLAPVYEPIAGLPPVTGPVSGNARGRTGLLLAFSPATHGEVWSRTAVTRKFLPFETYDLSFEALPAPVAVTNPLPEVRAFLEDLLLQALAPEPVTLEHPAPPQHDFDDDGEPDATDPTPYGG
ncbi:MAG: hypothetical protein R3B40_09315 [Polyangiales bacterium]